MKKTQVTITLTIERNENLKAILSEAKTFYVGDILGAWSPILIGCLEAKLNKINEDLVMNRNRVVGITSRSINYVDANNIHRKFSYDEIDHISKTIALLKASPRPDAKEFDSPDYRVMLSAISKVDSVIGPNTSNEIMKGVPFDVLHDTLVNQFEICSHFDAVADIATDSPSEREATCSDNYERTCHD